MSKSWREKTNELRLIKGGKGKTREPDWLDEVDQWR